MYAWDGEAGAPRRERDEDEYYTYTRRTIAWRTCAYYSICDPAIRVMISRRYVELCT